MSDRILELRLASMSRCLNLISCGSEPYLPTSSWLEPVICVVAGYILINGCEIQFVFLSSHDGLSDHLGIAEMRLYVLVFLFAQVHIILMYNHGARRAERGGLVHNGRRAAFG